MISIVIPVYNSAKYLNDCIESIRRQKYNDWECILIDDGSSDGSSRICDEWAEVDKRFKAFHQPNSGVSTARNNGIKYVSGEYITFIDSDDWIDDNYLSTLIANGGECDLIVSGIVDCYEGDNSSFSSCGYRSFASIYRHICRCAEKESAIWADE